MTNKLNRSDYLILDTLHGSNMTDQFHSMTIEEIMEETGNVLGVRMTVYRMVTKLVKLGYLEKGVMDNHANTYYLTNDGRKLFKGVFGDIKRLCSFKSLMGFKKEDSEELARIIMWNFPVDFFKCFEESYIFTYLWEGSIQKSYFDIHGIHYEKYMLDYDRKLIKHNKELEYEKRRKVVDLINIYEGKFNKIGMKIGKTNPLSKNWYESKRKSNLFMLEQLKANTENFFRTVSKTNSEDNMYTVRTY